MTFSTLRIAFAILALVVASPAWAQAAKVAAKPTPTPKDAGAPKPAPPAATTNQQPTSLGRFGDWQAFQLGTAKTKSCFAVSSPKERKPEGLNRDPATFFVTHRPGEGVRNEISLIAGFPMKEGGDASITIGKVSYSLYTKEANAWIKNAADEGTAVATMKKGKDVVFDGASRRGNKTTDRYSLTGFSEALAAISKACP